VRRFVTIAAALLVLGIANFTIAAREAILAGGRVVLLDLAPVDPRSIMQGDYMALRFRIEGQAFGSDRGAHPAEGVMIAKVGDDDVATFRRFDDGTPLAADEVRLRYRWRDGAAKLGTNAFFFEEGRAKDYAGARYGEARVGENGDVILTGLRGANREPLGR